MKYVLLPWKFFPHPSHHSHIDDTYDCFGLDGNMLVSIWKLTGSWQLYLYSSSLHPELYHFYDAFTTANEAMAYFEKRLLELGYELISEERTEKLRLLL